MPERKQRAQLLEMARTWENLAEIREWLVRNYPELTTGKAQVPAQSPSKQ